MPLPAHFPTAKAWIAASCVAWAIMVSDLRAQTADMDLVKSRIRQALSTGLASSTTIAGHQANLQADGTWPDINYASTAQTNWPPRTHLDRIRSMAKVYAWGPLQGNANLRDDIFRAYDAWITRDPQSTNWWYQSINTPQNLGEILILMEPELSPARRTSGLALIARSYVPRATNSGTNTGANRVDRAYPSMMRGLLSQDAALTTESFLAIGDTILTNSAHNFAEGIQADASFQQHGAQLYVAGYGYGYVQGVLKYASYGADTAFGYDNRQKRILLDHLVDGCQWFVRGNSIDYTSAGRGLTRADSTATANGYGAMLTNAISISGGYRQTELQAFRNRITAAISSGSAAATGSLVGNRNFWRSDFMTHHRPEFCISVKTSSTRTLQPESGNGEGLKNLHLADGVTLIQRTGNEYDDIMPVWDWRRLPGTTTEQGTYSLKPSTDWGMAGNSTHAGAVSDGTDGAAVFQYNRLGVAAKKSWFFLGDAMVALGADINSAASTQAVLTTLNQCLLSGAVNYGSAGSTATLTGSASPSSLDWVHHANTGYFFPTLATNANLSATTQSGTWQSINTAQSATVINKDVFSLHLSHGSAFSGGSYAYIVAPGVSLTNMASFPVANYQILRNDATAQAVRDAASDKTMAHFWTAGSTGGITSSAKASVIVGKTPEFLDLTVSDPSQTQTTSFTIELDSAVAGSLHADTSITVEQLSPTLRIRFAPAKSYGRSMRARFYLRPHAYETITLSPTADSFTHDGSAGTNYGSTPKLAVKWSNSSGVTRESYINFDLASIQRTPIAASLRLTPILVQTAGIHSVTALNSGSWSETGVKWNNRPFPVSSASATWLPALGARTSADVLPLVLARSGDSMDLCISTHAPTSDGYVDYASRETADPATHPALELVVARPEMEIWRLEEFGAQAGDPLIAGDAADPNGDGESNLIEYATGQDPQGNERAAISLMNPPAPSPMMDFTYTRARDTGFTFRVEWTENLAANSWSSNGIPDQNPQPIASDASSETLLIQVPKGSGKRFFRLQVVKP